MRCLNCNSKLRDDSTFCEYCGAKVGEMVEPKVEVTEPSKDCVYCEYCGNAISKEAYICPKCGQLTNNGRINKNVSDIDKVNVALNVLGFLIPFVGFIMWFVMREKTPNRAKQIGIWALIGFGLNIALQIFYR